MKWLALAVLALSFQAAHAAGEPACSAATALARPFPAPQATSSKAAAAARGGRLAIWTTDKLAELNEDFGLLLEFDDGTTCVAAISEAISHGVDVPIGRRKPKAVEIGICDYQRGLCVPARIEFSD